MDHHADERLRRELHPGETLRWSGRPGALALAGSRIFVSLFGLVFLTFALGWTSMAAVIGGVISGLGEGGPGFLRGFAAFPLFGVPFILVGLALALQAPLALFAAPRTFYGVTDRRVLIVGGVRGHVQSYGPGDLNALDRREGPDGRGSLVFRRESWVSHNGGGTRTIAFHGVPEVRRVEAELLRLRGDAPSRA